jgi:hypothetical protein
VERQFRQKDDIGSDDDFEYMAQIVDFFLGNPAGREYWEMQRGVFSATFVAIAPTPSVGASRDSPRLRPPAPREAL